MSQIQKPEIQQILAFFDGTIEGVFAIRHGLEISRIFSRGLTIVFYNSTEKELNSFENISALITYSSYKATTQLKELNDNIDEFIDQYNGIIAVLPIHSKKTKETLTAKTILKLFRNARIPYITTKTTPSESLYKNILFPINYYVENKEKALWASYFGRFHNSHINLVYRIYKDKAFINAQFYVLEFINKLFKNFSIKSDTHLIENIKGDINLYAIQNFISEKHQLIMVMNTLEYAFDDYLFGPPELKIMLAQKDIPILFLNPRKDLYCMCD